MPIKHLDGYLTERKHLQTLPLNVLSDSRLGIDASHYLHLLLDQAPSREPLLAATGGLPLALVQRIEADLRILEKLRIKPVFVFSGISPNKKIRPHLQQEYQEAMRDRQNAWGKYENGLEEQATKLFEGRANLVQWDVWRMVLRVFRHRNVEYLIAPYISWAQLIYLQRHPKSYIHAIFGPTDTLLYPGVDKLITSIDFSSSNPTFTYTSKRSFLPELQLSDEQFLDAGILVGCEHSLPFPPTGHETNYKATVDMVKFYKTGHATVSALAEHPGVKMTGYLEQFARARTLIKYSLILTAEGLVQPLPIACSNIPSGPHHPHHPQPIVTAADVPSDLADIFTNRLPDEVYFYLSRGLLSPQSLVWLTSGQILEPPPLDNGETTEYRRFVKEVVTDGQTGPRATAIALISSVLNSYWNNRRITGNFWFEQPQNPQGGPPNAHGQKYINHNSSQTAGLADRVAGWQVPYAIVEEELRRQNSSTIDFALCLGATANDKLANRTRVKKDKDKDHPLEKKDEAVANIIWRFLELRGFLYNSHTHTSLARAMFVAIKQARVNDKFQDPLYLFLELVRAGVMHGHLWSNRAFSGGPSFGTDDEKQCMLLVMRVLSIVPLNSKPQAWSAPLSRELLVFNSFVKSLTRALRTLLEVTSLNMLLRGDAKRMRDDFLDIALSLPFQTDVNTGFGILAKVYLDALTHINGRQCVRAKDVETNGDNVKEMKGLALDICEETFPGVKNPKGEVERGFRFWDCALTAIRQMHQEKGVLTELADQFEAAESWLRPMRP